MRKVIPLLFMLVFQCKAQNVIPLYANDSTKAFSNKSALILSLSNKTIKLPAGRFYLDGNIELPSGTTLIGKGDSTELIMSCGSESKTFFYITAVKTNITIKGVKINANIAANTGIRVIALAVADRVTNLTLENVSFMGARTYGCLQIKGTEAGFSDSIKIINCRFIQSGSIAIELRGVRHVDISKCYFTNWALLYKNAPAIQLQSQKCYDITIQNNLFENRSGVQFAIESAGTKGYGNVVEATISNNRFNDINNLGGNGISGYFTQSVFAYNKHRGGNGNQRSGYEIFGSDNKITHNLIEAGLIAVSAGTVTNTNTSNVLVEYNDITTKGTNSSGVLVGAWASLKTTNVTIANNTINTKAAKGNSSPVTIGYYGQPGIIDNIRIVNNTLYSNSESRPIRVQAADRSGTIITSGNVYTGTFINDVTHNTNIVQQ
jgi:hypothetical protein